MPSLDLLGLVAIYAGIGCALLLIGIFGCAAVIHWHHKRQRRKRAVQRRDQDIINHVAAVRARQTNQEHTA